MHSVFKGVTAYLSVEPKLSDKDIQIKINISSKSFDWIGDHDKGEIDVNPSFFRFVEDMPSIFRQLSEAIFYKQSRQEL
jgi:hypothetical protein